MALVVLVHWRGLIHLNRFKFLTKSSAQGIDVVGQTCNMMLKHVNALLLYFPFAATIIRRRNAGECRRLLAVLEAIAAAVGFVDTFFPKSATSLTWIFTVAFNLPPLTFIARQFD